MKNLIIIGVVIAIAIGVFHYVNTSAGEKRVEVRVTKMMDDWVAGGTSSDGYVQEAILMWFNGSKIPLDTDTMVAASMAFDKWRKAKGLYKKISTYKIESITAPEGALQDEYHVSIQIDGKRYGMRVARHEPIEWLE